MSSPSANSKLQELTLELELTKLKAKPNHSTSKLIAICTLVGTLVGAPGFWTVFRSSDPPPPPVTREDTTKIQDQLDQIATDVTEIKAAQREDRKGFETRLKHLEDFADRYTPSNRARIPRN